MPLTFLDALGVRVLRVDGLDEGALFVEDRQILFLDSSLDRRGAIRMANHALAYVDHGLDLEPPTR